MKEFIFNAHNAAKKKVNMALDLEFLLENIKSFLTGDSDVNEITQKLKDKYGKQCEIYIEVFTATMIDEVLQEGIKKGLEKSGRFNNKEFSGFLKKQTKRIINAVKEYLHGKVSQEELMDFLINDVFINISVEVLKAYDINKDDIDTLLKYVKKRSYNMIAYAILVELYNAYMELMLEAAMIHEERLKIEKHCKELVEKITEYRNEINNLVSDYLFENITSFQEGIHAMDIALLEGDSNGYIAANMEIQKAMGRDVQFTNQDEFDDLMDSDFDFRL